MDVAYNWPSDIKEIWPADDFYGDWTHEHVEAIHAQEGTGCKNCDGPTTGLWWFPRDGDLYCFYCALQMQRELGVKFKPIPTTAQIEAWRAAEAQGIGVN